MKSNRTWLKLSRLLLLMMLALVLSVTAVPASAYLSFTSFNVPSGFGKSILATDEASSIANHIQEAKEQEAQGRYSQACTTLLQTLTSAKLGCESLNQDEIFYKVTKELDRQFPNSGKPVKDLSLKVTALLGFGEALGVVVSLDKSMEVLQRGLEVAKQLSSQAEAEALLSLGNTAQALGNKKRDTEDSIKQAYDEQNYYNEAQPTLPLLSCDIGEPETEQNSSDKQAIAFYQESIAYYQLAACKAKSPITRAQAELNRFNLLIQIDKWLHSNQPKFANNWWFQVAAQIPENWQQKIQEQIKELPPSQAAIYIRINLAQSLTYLHLKNQPNSNLPQEIVELLVKARQQARDILHDTRLESSVNGNLGGLYEKTHHLTEALENTELAWHQAESLYVNGRDLFYQWAWQKGRLLQQLGKIKEAIYAYKEAFNALQLLRNDLLGINLDTQFSFRDNVESVYRELVGLLVQYDSSQGALGLTLKQDINSGIVQIAEQKIAIDIWQEKFDLSIGVIQNLQLAELENFLQCNLLNVTTKPINQLADDSSAAVFYPIILEDKAEVIVKVPNNPDYHYQVNSPRYDIEKKLKDLAKALRTQDKQEKIKGLSSLVYDWLIRRAEPYLIKNHVKSLVFVLDGVLRNIPMSVLYDREKQEYLIEKYSVAITPGLNILGPKSLPTKQLKVLIGAYSQAPNPPVKVKGTPYAFGELKQVLKEAKDIKDLFSGSIELIDQNFTNENLEKALNSASYSIVHLATHGNFSSDPQQTFIVTASEEPFKVNDFKNILQTRVQTNKAPIDLLVFSACETATGDRRATLGIAGAAIRAGASSTLATLWSVRDNPTALLMQKFYSYLKNQKMTKAEALRLAQLELKKDYKEPYYWAPFILVENWR